MGAHGWGGRGRVVPAVRDRRMACSQPSRPRQPLAPPPTESTAHPTLVVQVLVPSRDMAGKHYAEHVS